MMSRVASPLARLAQSQSQQSQGHRVRNAALVVGGALLIGEAVDRIPTRIYLRLANGRLGWQKAAQAARSEMALHDGDVHAAEKPWRTAVAVVASALGDSDWETLEARIELAGLLLLQGTADKVAEAEALLTPASPEPAGRLHRRDSFSAQQETRMRHRASRTRVSVLMAQQKLEDAEALASGCVEQGVATYGEFDEDTARAKDVLREAQARREARLDPSQHGRSEAGLHAHGCA